MRTSGPNESNYCRAFEIFVSIPINHHVENGLKIVVDYIEYWPNQTVHSRLVNIERRHIEFTDAIATALPPFALLALLPPQSLAAGLNGTS
jgi:hypothetical protein